MTKISITHLLSIVLILLGSLGAFAENKCSNALAPESSQVTPATQLSNNFLVHYPYSTELKPRIPSYEEVWIPRSDFDGLFEQIITFLEQNQHSIGPSTQGRHDQRRKTFSTRIRVLNTKIEQLKSKGLITLHDLEALSELYLEVLSYGFFANYEKIHTKGPKGSKEGVHVYRKVSESHPEWPSIQILNQEPITKLSNTLKASNEAITPSLLEMYIPVHNELTARDYFLTLGDIAKPINLQMPGFSINDLKLGQTLSDEVKIERLSELPSNLLLEKLGATESKQNFVAKKLPLVRPKILWSKEVLDDIAFSPGLGKSPQTRFKEQQDQIKRVNMAIWQGSFPLHAFSFYKAESSEETNTLRGFYELFGNNGLASHYQGATLFKNVTDIPSINRVYSENAKKSSMGSNPDNQPSSFSAIKEWTQTVDNSVQKTFARNPEGAALAYEALYLMTHEENMPLLTIGPKYVGKALASPSQYRPVLLQQIAKLRGINIKSPEFKKFMEESIPSLTLLGEILLSSGSPAGYHYHYSAPLEN